MFDFLRNRAESEHEWVEESLSAYIDGELSAKDTARVEKHLQECQACAESLATLRQTVALVRELPTIPAPHSFAIRPAPVRLKARLVPPRWGYGLLKGATALATLLFMILIGGDLALQFLGGFRLAAPAPLAPAAEVALAPSPSPGTAPMGPDEEWMVGEGKAPEMPTMEAPPSNAQDLPAPAAAVTETREVYLAPPPQDTARPVSETVGGGEATVTPTSAATPAETPLPEEQEIRGAVEPTAAPAPTATPEVVAMADITSEELEARGDAHLLAETPRLLPLRLAELVVFILLLLLIPATLLTGWPTRRRRL